MTIYRLYDKNAPNSRKYDHLGYFRTYEIATFARLNYTNSVVNADDEVTWGQLIESIGIGVALDVPPIDIPKPKTMVKDEEQELQDRLKESIQQSKEGKIKERDDDKQ